MQETIHLANKRVEITDEVKKRVQEAQEKSGSNKLTVIKIVIVGILIPTLMMAFHKRLQADKAIFEEFVRFAKEADEGEIRKIQQAFVFDDDRKK